MSIKIILGIESSCDETAAAILKKDGDNLTILSNVVATSLELQSKWGGVVPEQAAREQLKSIIPVITEALEQAHLTKDDIDAIAVTQGPGLIGSLLVGVETAKTLSLIWQKPLIPINHLIGHFYANWINFARGGAEREISGVDRSEVVTSEDAPEKPKRQDPEQKIPEFPCLGLLVSGGHSDLVLFTNHGKYKYLGGTRDDAAGECFDKCARLLGLPYPGGPEISKLAKVGNPAAYNLPLPMHNSQDLDFSFSGLKTAVANLVDQLTDHQTNQLTKQQTINLSASIQSIIIKSLVEKTLQALKITRAKQLIIAGGVAANEKLNQTLLQQLPPDIVLFTPPPALCTDNAAMIAAAALFHSEAKTPLEIQANPNLSLSY